MAVCLVALATPATAPADVRVGGVRPASQQITAITASDDEGAGRLSLALTFAEPTGLGTTAFVELSGKDACADAVDGSRIPSQGDDTTASIAVSAEAASVRFFGHGTAAGTLTRSPDARTLYATFEGPIYADNDWRCVRGSDAIYDVARDTLYATPPLETFAFYFNGYAPRPAPKPRLATAREKRAIVGAGARCYVIRVSRLDRRYASVTYDQRTYRKVRGCTRLASDGIDIYRRRDGRWRDVGGMSDCPTRIPGVPGRIYRELTAAFCDDATGT